MSFSQLIRLRSSFALSATQHQRNKGIVTFKGHVHFREVALEPEDEDTVRVVRTPLEDARVVPTGGKWLRMISALGWEC